MVGTDQILLVVRPVMPGIMVGYAARSCPRSSPDSLGVPQLQFVGMSSTFLLWRNDRCPGWSRQCRKPSGGGRRSCVLAATSKFQLSVLTAEVPELRSSTRLGCTEEGFLVALHIGAGPGGACPQVQDRDGIWTRTHVINTASEPPPPPLSLPPPLPPPLLPPLLLLSSPHTHTTHTTTTTTRARRFVLLFFVT